MADSVAAFDAAAEDFVRLAPRLWNPLGQILVDHTAPRPWERVLDACCGAGASALPAARAVGAGGCVDAVDLSRLLLEHGRRAAWALPQARFAHGDVSTWQPAGGPYDLVQSAYGVFFLPDMDAGGRHLVSLLHFGGRFAVQTWRRSALADYGRCLFAAVSDELQRPIERPPSAAARERIDSQEKLGQWLTSLGLVGVRVKDMPFVQPLTPGLAWDLVLGSNWRHLLMGLDPAAALRIRDGLLARIKERNLTELDAGSLVGIGVRPDPA